MTTTFEKTWQMIANSAMDNSSTTNTWKNMAWWIKAFLKGDLSGYKDITGSGVGSPSGLWTTYYSCDGTTAGTPNDGYDHWASSFVVGNIVAAAGAHSWYVLKSPVGLGPYYFTIDMNSSTTGTISISASKTAPTGGTTSARPTATDEMQLSTWINFNIYGISTQGRMHGGIATDGNFHIASSADTNGWRGGIFFQSLTEAKSNDLYKVNIFAFGSTNTPTVINLQTTNNTAMRSFNGGTVISPLAATWNTTSSNQVFASMTTVDFTDSQYDDLPIYWYVPTVGYKSIRGRWADYRWCPTLLKDGTVESSQSTPTSTVIGNIWIPYYTVPTL